MATHPPHPGTHMAQKTQGAKDTTTDAHGDGAVTSKGAGLDGTTRTDKRGTTSKQVRG